MSVTIEERRTVLGGFREDVPVHYLTAGTGPPLVLLHGVGDSADTWLQVLPALARTHRVFAPSFPGFGRSAQPATAYSPAFFTIVLQRFLEMLGIGQAVLVGNSLGGLVATRLALAAPSRVTALCLVDSAGLGRQLTIALRLLNLPGNRTIVTSWNKTQLGAWQWALQMTSLLFAKPARVPPEWFAGLQQMARSDGYLRATVDTVRSASNLRGQLKREQVLDDLPRLHMPTLIMWGERDRVVSARQAQNALKRLPQGQLVIIPDCGHVPQLECPDQFVDVLNRFLAAIPSLQPSTVEGDVSIAS